MSSPRVRRLQSEYECISTRFTGWPLVQIELADGIPPDIYNICYNIKGLYVNHDGRIIERDKHMLEIKLGLEYPRRAPQLRLLTPLFHPNFNQTEVCAQDIYAASEGLDDLIIRIGRMIAYQEYNTKSPLNGIAAKWAAENSHRLPVDKRNIAPPSFSKKTAIELPPIPQNFIQQSVDERTSGIVITMDEIAPGTSNKKVQRNDSDCPKCGMQLFERSVDNVGSILECPNCRMSIAVPPPSQKAWFTNPQWLSTGIDIDDNALYYLDQESIQNDGDGFKVSIRAIPLGNDKESEVPVGTAYVCLLWKIYPKRKVFDILSFQFYDARDKLLSNIPCQMLTEMEIKPGTVVEKILNGYATVRLQ